MNERWRERYERIVQMVQQGRNISEICEVLQCNPRTVGRAKEWAGLTRPVRPSTPLERQDALELLRDGASYREVGRTLGRTWGTIARWHPGFAWTPQEAGAHGLRVRNMERRI